MLILNLLKWIWDLVRMDNKEKAEKHLNKYLLYYGYCNS